MSAETLDLFDRLAALDWSGRFDSFSAEQIRNLCQYDKLATDLGRSSFFGAPVTLSIKTGVSLEHAGSDSLRSMAMTFRQLWMTSEPARFPTIRKTLRSAAKPATETDGVDVVAMLDEVGGRYSDASRDVMMQHVWVDDPLGEPKEVFRAEQVINDWFYAGVFHTDAEKVERVEAWTPTAYQWSVVKAMHGVAATMWELQLVVAGALHDA